MARRSAEEGIDTVLEAHRHFVADAIAVESNQFQELLAQQMIAKARAAGMPAPITQLVNTVNKHVRIRRLGPYLAQNGIRFRSTPGTRILVNQLRDFPVADHDDGPDALEMALRCMIETHNGRRNNAGPRRLRA